MISRTFCRSVAQRCIGLRVRRWTSTTSSFIDPDESCVSGNNHHNSSPSSADSSTVSKNIADKFAIGVSITKSVATMIFNNNNNNNKNESRSPPVPTSPLKRNEQVKTTAACGDVVPNPVNDEADEMEQEEMFVDADESLGMKEREWGGPRRGGRFPEPTRFGDWERKGRCTDF